MNNKKRIAVCADPPHETLLRARADTLAKTLSVHHITPDQPGFDLLLVVTHERLELRVLNGEPDLIGGNGVYADLASIDTSSPAGRKLDMPLLKAVGIKKGTAFRPHVIDCTAGLGEDAWLLASHGCTVQAIERQPVLAALLDDALNRARQTQPATADRLNISLANAIESIGQTAYDPPTHIRPDAIVLDPMFPTGRKAKERKPMRVLRMLAGNDDDAPDLLQAALATGVHRICVKRPLKAPLIANHKRPAPDVVYKGKAVRFDVYLNNQTIQKT